MISQMSWKADRTVNMMRVFLLAAIALLPAAAAAQPTATCAVEAGFSPEGSASALVLRAIGSARESIRLAAYLFTSPDIARALIAARRKGVDVQAVVDREGAKNAASRAALNLLAGAGIPVRTVSGYAIHHDKYMVIDGATVQTGSFNYTAAAARDNSENVLLASACPALARQYLEHWQSRWRQGVGWRLKY